MTVLIHNNDEDVTLNRAQVAMLKSAIESMYNWSIRPNVDSQAHRAFMEANRDYCMRLLDGGNDE